MAEPRRRGEDWELDDGEELHRQHPRRFFIPSRQARGSLQVDDVARLRFVLTARGPDQPQAERMWVQVTSVNDGGYTGILDCNPTAIRDLEAGDTVFFEPRHVIAILDEAYERDAEFVAFVNQRLVEDDRLEPGLVIHDPADLAMPPRGDGSRPSGWQLLVGDETDEELSDPAGVLTPNLMWLMDRYPPFGTLVRSGASDGTWRLSDDGAIYERV
jgi:Uncharacterized protein conserved in bacteria (DUF2314)